MENKQTAVEWFIQQLVNRLNGNGDSRSLDEIFEQAKAMEKEQMKKVSKDWWNEGARYMYGASQKNISFEEYYNETYSK